MIAVIVILVHGTNDRGGVNQRRSGRTRVPEEPVVPTGAAIHEFRNALAEKALAKGKNNLPIGKAAGGSCEEQDPGPGGPNRSG